jgi:hypothetical protein
VGKKTDEGERDTRTHNRASAQRCSRGALAS